MNDKCVFNPSLAKKLQIGANLILFAILIFISFHFFLNIDWST